MGPTAGLARRLAGVAVAALAAALGAAGCGIPAQRHPVVIRGLRLPPERVASGHPSAPSTAPLVLYLVRHSALVPVSAPGAAPTLPGALKLLLDGPTNSEAAGGLSTAVPVSTTLEHWTLDGGVAHLDFSKALGSVSGQEQVLAFAQIVMTATSLPGVTLVALSVAGQPVNPPNADGVLAQGPVGRSDYTPLLVPGPAGALAGS